LLEAEDQELLSDTADVKIPAETDAPVIKTHASVNGKKIAKCANELAITDIIDYKNLQIDQEYKLTSSVVLKEDGAAGKVLVTGNFTFTPEESSGSQEIKLFINAADLEGMSVVVFEELFLNDTLVAEHKDIDSEAQTVHFGAITTALYSENGKFAAVSESEKITDTVILANLPAGTYMVAGKLYDSDGNDTGIEATEIIEVEGNAIEIELLNYDVDTTKYLGDSLVSAVTVFLDGEVILEHTDLTNVDQTVYIPEMLTFASNGNDGKDIKAAKEAFVVDHVVYSGLKPYTKYTLEASLYDPEADEFVTLSNGEKGISVDFYSSDMIGSADVVLSFDSTAYSGKALVVFEKLYCDGNLIAIHYDLEDDDQTVYIPISPAVYKYDGITKEPLKGAKILIKDLSSGANDVVETDIDGIAYFALISGHQYSYQEQEAPAGYSKDSNIYYFSVDAQGETSKETQTLYNYKEGVVVIRKIDVKTGYPVEGAKITISDKNGATILTQTTDKFGRIYADLSAYRDEGTRTKFTYKETAAPSGYYQDTTTHTFYVEKDGSATGDLRFVNAPYGTIMITKTDPDGNPLSGARISIYTAAGKMVGQATTNSSGHIYFSAPEAGSYYFIEDQAPNGYARVDQKFAFSIDSYGRISGTTTFQNSKAGSKGVATGDDDSLMWYGFSAVIAFAAIILFVDFFKKKKAAGNKNEVTKPETSAQSQNESQASDSADKQ